MGGIIRPKPTATAGENMKHLYETVKPIIQQAYDESKHKGETFCNTDCPFKKYCKTHEEFFKLCLKPLDKLCD
jgi:hypothetical protein